MDLALNGSCSGAIHVLCFSSCDTDISAYWEERSRDKSNSVQNFREGHDLLVLRDGKLLTLKRTENANEKEN